MKGIELLSVFQLFSAGVPAFHSAPATSGCLKYANEQVTNAFRKGTIAFKLKMEEVDQRRKKKRH